MGACGCSHECRGRINLEYGQGALVMIRDHINLQGQNPLAG